MRQAKLLDAKAAVLALSRLLKYGLPTDRRGLMRLMQATRCWLCGQMMPEGTPAEYAACGRHGARRLVHHRVVDCTDAIDAIPWLETFERDIYVGDLSGEQTCVRYKEKRPVMEYVPAPDDSTDLEVIRICGVCVR